MKPYVRLSLIALLLSPCLVLAHEHENPLCEKIDALLVEAYAPDEPGCSVLVLWDDEVLFAQGYGVMEKASMRSITPETRFRLASISKQFTAMAILLLVEQGRLSLDATLTDVFVDFPSYGNAITVHHLLTHSSGLMDYEGLIPDDATEQVHDADVLRIMMDQRVTLFEPGSEFRYSNSGYALLAMIVEARSGMRFAEFLQEELFAPLGIPNAVAFEQGLSVVTNRAYGHVPDDSGEFVMNDQSLTSAVLGDGGIYMSTQEYAVWARRLRHAPPVSAPLMDKAQTAYFDRSEIEGYGYGWQIIDTPAGTLLSHGGSTRGFINYAILIPEQGFLVIALSNRTEDTAAVATRAITNMLLEENGFPPVYESVAN